jgi:hypothetical protein
MRQRFRQWWREEGLLTVIVLAICIPLILLAVASLGGNGGSIGEMYNPNRSFRPISFKPWSGKREAQATLGSAAGPVQGAVLQ